MKTRANRLISILSVCLCICLIWSLFPTIVMADYDDGCDCEFCGHYRYDDWLCENGDHCAAGYGCGDEHHCNNCGACDEGENFCSECILCIECAIDAGSHCPECGDCLVDASNFCEECGRCPNCFDEWCSNCHMCVECAVDNNKHCTECGVCHDEANYCFLCGRCLECGGQCSDGCEDSCLICHLENEVACETCGACFIFDNHIPCQECLEVCSECADDWCEDCKMCHECAVNTGCHCPECEDCLVAAGDFCSECNRCYNCIDEWCNDCNMCSECAIDAGKHCPDCGVCHENIDYCFLCGRCLGCGGQCSDGCEDSCLICHLENEVACETCGACFIFDDHIPCQECREVCSECADDWCEACKMCHECAVNTGCHCQECEDCLVEAGDFCSECNRCHNCIDEWCSNCNMCLECAIDAGKHCPDCGVCHDEANYCFLCGRCLGCGDQCADGCEDSCLICHLENEAACETCGACFIFDNHIPCQECLVVCSECADDWCEACKMCYECAVNTGCHCQECEECLVEADNVCEHCNRCSNCFGEWCDSCNMCYECAIDNDCHCPICGECLVGCTEGSDFCANCYTCKDCAAICPNGDCCSECSIVCEQCATCENCAIICINGDVCSECSDICEDCKMCLDCAIIDGFHCPNCIECGLDVDICPECGEVCSACADEWCDTCGMCLNCAIDKGLHCSNCEACGNDVTICPECKQYCSDCSDICLYCELCEECCHDNSENEGCNCGDHICVESPDWDDHFSTVHQALSCEHSFTEVKNKKQATCIEDGYTGDTYCKDCGEKLSVGEIIPASHIWESDYTVDKEATATEEGSKSIHCENCDSRKAVTAIPRLSPLLTVEPTIEPTLEPTGSPIPTSAPKRSAGSFINRCYEVALGREADEAGYEFWCDGLDNGNICGAQAAYGFIFSDEYKNKNTSNEEFINDMYAMFFGREADVAGFEYWIEQLNNGTATREDILAGFANSDEFFSLCERYDVVSGTYLVGVSYDSQSKINAFVTRLYKVCLNSLPDQAGQTVWVSKLINGEITETDCVFGFVFSPEFVGKDSSNTEYVEYMYEAFFGREADEEGFNYWVGQLDNGTASREDIFNGFAGSVEFDNFCSSVGTNV